MIVGEIFHTGILAKNGLRANLEYNESMEQLLLDIIDRLRLGDVTPNELAQIIRDHNDNVTDVSKHLAKKKLLPFYLKTKSDDPDRWASWNVDDALERKIFDTLRMKPRRTSSGVATITVITKPQPCGSNCVYCPNDLRMPKSYLSNEPACQRAERNFFDPYLQVASRMRALTQMGHATDKVELIVLGGTWSDYTRPYQLWFMKELFRALNEWPMDESELANIRKRYEDAGISSDPDVLEELVRSHQAAIDRGEETYNQAFATLYGDSTPHLREAENETATKEELIAQQSANENSAHRVVGLVIETRPDTVTPQNLTFFRELGCTKIQIGVQSTREEILCQNNRFTPIEQVTQAFSLIRLYGFKIHSHLMVNLVGSTPESDIEDYREFVTNPAFLPDEVKLYPCALVSGTGLVSLYEQGRWRPYTETELIDVLSSDTLATPPYIRISRMIRDISACDIMVGNKKTNLRQMVESHIEKLNEHTAVQEIRFREINRQEVQVSNLHLSDFAYETALTQEHFLQWVTDNNRIAGFLRLSLPKWNEINARDINDDLAVSEGDAMIREVHVYGQAAHLGKDDASAQHHGLGRKLIEQAEEIARAEGYVKLNVISSVGTREYYRKQGFAKDGLYQSIIL